MHNDDELMTTSQVAELRNANIATVNRWARNGELPVAMKLPGRNGANLFRRSDVEAFRASDDEAVSA